MHKSYDYVIIGAGIVGLCVARTLVKNKAGSVLIIEKESEIGLHASGRNSGVLHSGIYYPTHSLKAQFCKAGAMEMKDFVEEHELPTLKTGKVIVAQSEKEIESLKKLFEQ